MLGSLSGLFILYESRRCYDPLILLIEYLPWLLCFYGDWLNLLKLCCLFLLMTFYEKWLSEVSEVATDQTSYNLQKQIVY